MTSTKCGSCGFEGQEGANYCARCGTFLVADDATTAIPVSLPGVGRDPDSTDPVEPQGGHGAALIIRSGGGRAGERFTIPDKLTIGRAPESDVFLDDVTVSREHAVIYNDSNSVRVEDRASLNGTFVNNERVEKHTVVHGDEIQIGKYKFTYLAD